MLRVYTHDEDVTGRNFLTMNDWWCYSSEDMVNWTDHGCVLSYTDFSWSTVKHGRAMCRKNGIYFYVPLAKKSGGEAIV